MGLPSARLFLTSILTCMGSSFHFGYQIVLTNPSQAAFIKFLNASIVKHYDKNLSQNTLENYWSLIVALFFFGLVPGALSLRFLADKLGRKRGLILGYLLNLLSASVSIISKFIVSFELYAISRFTLGFSIALSLGLSSLFLTESSPKECRGFVSMTLSSLINVATIFGSIMSMPQIFGTESSWWIIYLIECVILMVVLAIFYVTTYDSPGFLVLQGEEKEARYAIKAYYACREEDIDGYIEEIRENLKSNNSSKVGMIDIWKNGMYRRLLIPGLVMALVSTFSGIAAIDAYTVDILQNAGMSLETASWFNAGLMCVAFTTCVASSAFVDSFGRRPLSLVTNFGLIIVNIFISGLMYAYDKEKCPWLGYCLIFFIACQLFFFAGGPGPMAHFLAAELVDQNARSAGQSWGTLTQMLMRAIMLAGYLPLSNALGQAWTYFLCYVGPLIVCWLLLYTMLPESKGRQFKEIVEERENLPSLRNLCQRGQRNTLED